MTLEPVHEAKPDSQDAVRTGQGNCIDCGWPIHPWWATVGPRRERDLRWRHTSHPGMSYRRHKASLT